MLYFCPVFWLRDINIYLVSSGFTSSLLASNKASVFLYGIYVFSHYINIISKGEKLVWEIMTSP
jgi:hypothetical protein